MLEIEKRLQIVGQEMQELASSIAPLWQWLEKFRPEYEQKVNEYALLNSRHRQLDAEQRRLTAEVTRQQQALAAGKNLSKAELRAVVQKLGLLPAALAAPAAPAALAAPAVNRFGFILVESKETTSLRNLLSS